MERIVGRADLHLEDSASSSSAELEEDWLGTKPLIEFEFVEGVKNRDFASHGEESIGGVDEDEYEFRLFDTADSGNNEHSRSGLHKIRLDSPSTSTRNEGFLQPERDRNYYFTNPLSPKNAEQMKTTALTGEDVLSMSRRPWPGCAYPWRVLHLPPSRKQQHLQPFHRLGKLIVENVSSNRKRAGKKHRIKIRQERAKLSAQQDAATAAAKEKEAAEREKRTRRNREKKVKKKERDKAKKSTATVNEGGQPAQPTVE